MSKAVRPPFSSKLLSKRPAQTASTQDGLPGQTTTLLPDGRLLKIGGLEPAGPVGEVVIGESRVQLQRRRAWHTATMLPDGNVLIVGGIGLNGRVVEEAEIFTPETNTSELLRSRSSIFNPQPSAPTPRAYHSATLLTEGLGLHRRWLGV